jgi:hypothetical protein
MRKERKIRHFYSTKTETKFISNQGGHHPPSLSYLMVENLKIVHDTLTLTRNYKMMLGEVARRLISLASNL